MTFSHTVEHQIGDIVFSPIDEDARGVVVGITFLQSGVKYIVAWGVGDEVSVHPCELCKEKKISV